MNSCPGSYHRCDYSYPIADYHEKMTCTKKKEKIDVLMHILNRFLDFSLFRGSPGILGYKAKYGCKYHIPLDFSIVKGEKGVSSRHP